MTTLSRNEDYHWIEGSGFGGDYDLFDGRNLATSPSQYGVLYIFQVIASIMSIFATIVVVRISVPKLDSTYQRYIFMLNVALLVNSIFLALHPLLVPNDTGGPWAFGNAGTCTMVGFFLVFGSCMVSLYHTAIAFYFYFSVEQIQGNYNNRSKKSNQDNERRMTRTAGSASSEEDASESTDDDSPSGGLGAWAEVVANMVCLFFPVIFAGAAAGLKDYGYDPAIGLCTLYKSSGLYYEDGWKIMRQIYMWTLVVSGLCTVLITIIVRCRVRIFQKKDNGDDAANSHNKNSNASGSSLGDPDGVSDDFERQIIGQKLSAIAAQCLYYTLSYTSSFVWFIILAFLSHLEVKEGTGLLFTFQIMTAICYPLLGVFNCAIYVRPRVQMLQIMYPEDSQIAIMRVAMSKAGDPEEIEEVRAKIFGDDYYAPEEDDGEASKRSGLPGIDEDHPSKLQIPTHVQFGTTPEKASHHDDDKDSVSQISDI